MLTNTSVYLFSCSLDRKMRSICPSREHASDTVDGDAGDLNARFRKRSLVVLQYRSRYRRSDEAALRNRL